MLSTLPGWEAAGSKHPSWGWGISFLLFAKIWSTFSIKKRINETFCRRLVGRNKDSHSSWHYWYQPGFWLPFGFVTVAVWPWRLLLCPCSLVLQIFLKLASVGPLLWGLCSSHNLSPFAWPHYRSISCCVPVCPQNLSQQEQTAACR